MKHYHNWHAYCVDCGNEVTTNLNECPECGAGSTGEGWKVSKEHIGDPEYTTSAYNGGDEQ